MRTLPIPRAELSEACEALPIFPLPRVVFFPHTLLPLHVFEERYRALVADVIAGSGLLGVPLLAPGWEADYDGCPAIVPVFGVGAVLRHELLPDGRSNILLAGVGRARLLSEHPPQGPYRVARADLLPDYGADAPGLSQSAAQLVAVLGQLATTQPEIGRLVGHLSSRRRPAPEVLDTVAHFLITEPEERQGYIELDDVPERAARVLAAAAEMLSGGGAFDA